MNQMKPLAPGGRKSEKYPELDGVRVVCRGTSEPQADPPSSQCFLNLLYTDIHHSEYRFGRAVNLFNELQERGAFPSELEPYWDKIMAHETPNTNLTLFTHILSSVAHEFDEQYLALWPTEERRIVKTLMSTDGLSDSSSEDDTSGKKGRRKTTDARCLLDVVTGEGKLKSVDDRTGKYSLLSVHESVSFLLSPRLHYHTSSFQLTSSRLSPQIRRLALDIQAVATSPASHHSSIVTPEQALYAALLVPSVISQPHTGPEAVIHLTSAALKLAEHVGRYFPFDISLVETVVLPLVWGQYATSTIKRIVQEVKRREAEVVVKRRAEGSPKGRVGQLCIDKEEKQLGVVVGWDEDINEATCGESAFKVAQQARR
jgi:hypothetical protein